MLGTGVKGLLLALTTSRNVAGLKQLKFSWPNQTNLCDTFPLTIADGIPPFHFTFLPLGGLPFVRDIGDPPSGNWMGAVVRSQVQIPYQHYYSIMLTDGTGLGGGGVMPIQQVGPGPSDCLDEAGYNFTQQLFTFNVSGSTSECDWRFRVMWDGPPSQGPYTFTVIPFTLGYQPFNVQLDAAKQYHDWQVNMTEGTYFTIMFNNKLGNGTGGIGELYQVTRGANPGCGTQKYDNTSSSLYILPSGLSAVVLPSTQPLPETASASSSLSAGAIVGIAVGAVAVIAAIVICLFLYKSNKDKSRANGRTEPDGPLDIIGDDTIGPTLQPWISPVSLAPASQAMYDRLQPAPSTSGPQRNNDSHHPPIERPSDKMAMPIRQAEEPRFVPALRYGSSSSSAAAAVHRWTDMGPVGEGYTPENDAELPPMYATVFYEGNLARPRPAAKR